jgi:hypothetical protein
MTFDESYKVFLDAHCKRRQGECLRRLEKGLGHAELKFLENIWWPIFHQFDRLHPEYEIKDYNDGYRYIDFAYILPYFRVAIEIDGFGTHFRNITKWHFSDHCHRQNQLVIDGWTMIRFSYDDIAERPRLCQQTLQQLMGQWSRQSVALTETTVTEREVIRLITRSQRPITPAMSATSFVSAQIMRRACCEHS